MTCRFGNAITFGSAAALLLLSGCQPSGPVAQKADADRLVAVRTVAVTESEIQPTTTQPASVHAFYRSEIRAKVPGFVSELKVDIGDVVQAGQVLAQIDVPEMEKQRQIIQARIARLKAEEKRATAGVNLADAQVRSSQARLAQAESEMSRVDASLAAAQSEFERTSDLVERGSLQDRMLDESRKKRDSERAAKQAVASAIESAKANVAVTEAQKAAAEADLEAAQAETMIAERELEELQVMIDYATVRAPLAGIVSQRNVEPGDLVGSGADQASTKPLFVISQIDKLRVRIPVPETEAAHINPGDEVTLTFPTFSGEPAITAAVTRQSGSLDPSTRTMIVEVELENAEGKLLPGMFGRASIKLGSKVAANMLPSRAIRFSEEGNATVYVLGQDDTVTVAAIETGLDDGNSIQVRSGLLPGQRVIDAHLKRFTDGQKVSVLAN
ncbi:Solvent efflux pump periplasmic linker SrpA precursor [Stieleria maiorica]|uniref:Solvent efflux pump periplasmic linker SrpA n=1 Tax=Stieleria maiorica TaxID=2795974 RepID=A0A5B9MRK8_9BACT|nr:efflux RND transporter periplasmic adaptor subunit [Stieleria maiorica]QEG02707.1 Solvent efflux pump periplasmic linker SrpA precursor [Stieleria maiorica]